jgi:uncharacterized protein involved in exopolysaccharide biosynthesis
VKTNNLIGSLQKLWRNRSFLLKASICCLFISLIYAFSRPDEYTSSTKFLTQSESNDVFSNLGSVGILANMNFGGGGDQEYISPLIYNQITEDIKFLRDLLASNVLNEKGDSLTVKKLLLTKDDDQFSFFAFSKSEMTDNLDNEISISYPELLLVDKIEYNLFLLIKSLVSVDFDGQTRITTISAKSNDPVVAASIVKNYKGLLQTRIIEIKTAKLKHNLEYLSDQLDIAKKDLKLAQVKWADFKMSNQDLYSYQATEQGKILDLDMSLKYGVVEKLSKLYLDLKIEIDKNVPIFTNVDEQFISPYKSSPRRSMLILGAQFVLTVFILMYILLKDIFFEIVKDVFSNTTLKN